MLSYIGAVLSYIGAVLMMLVVMLVVAGGSFAIGAFLFTVGKGGTINFVPVPLLGLAFFGIAICAILCVPYYAVSEAHDRLPKRLEHAPELVLALAAVVAIYLVVTNGVPPWASSMAEQLGELVRTEED